MNMIRNSFDKVSYLTVKCGLNALVLVAFQRL